MLAACAFTTGATPLRRAEPLCVAGPPSAARSYLGTQNSTSCDLDAEFLVNFDVTVNLFNEVFTRRTRGLYHRCDKQLRGRFALGPHSRLEGVKRDIRGLAGHLPGRPFTPASEQPEG
jgi:hypothetical protein